MELKGGGVRRGPYVKKRKSFATKLTDETMDALAKAAERDGQSISQKAEKMIAVALKAEDAVERAIGPAVDAFRQTVLMVITAAEGRGPEEDQAVAQRVHAAAERLAAALEPKPMTQVTKRADSPTAAPKAKRSPNQTRRLIDISERDDNDT